jgi:AcrR family transcriptional regulator
MARRNGSDVLGGAAPAGSALPLRGLRERKKRERRQAIAAQALRLFAERGFDHVTMRDVARAADVSEPTVYNYFPTKESLVFHEDRERELALVRAVRDRPPGTGVVAAFRDTALELLDRHRREARPDWIRVVQGSPALQRYRRELYARHALSLAAVLREEAGGALGDVAALSVGRALMGVIASVAETFGQRVVMGGDPRRVGPEVRAEAARAFELLEAGLRALGG